MRRCPCVPDAGQSFPPDSTPPLLFLLPPWLDRKGGENVVGKGGWEKSPSPILAGIPVLVGSPKAFLSLKSYFGRGKKVRVVSNNMTTELESRTFWFGADTSQTFTALFAPELILNFGAVSLTLAIFRTISHLVSGQ